MSKKCKCFDAYLHSTSGVTKKMLAKYCAKCSPLIKFPYYFKKETIGQKGECIDIYGVMYDELNGLFITKKTYLFLDVNYEISTDRRFKNIFDPNEKSSALAFNKIRNEITEFIRQ